jgi:hypothetical protein
LRTSASKHAKTLLSVEHKSVMKIPMRRRQCGSVLCGSLPLFDLAGMLREVDNTWIDQAVPLTLPKAVKWPLIQTKETMLQVVACLCGRR